MDIIIKSVLSFIQGQEGHENSIIAGGAVRDEIYNLQPSDYDFCIPSKGKDMYSLAEKLALEFKTSVMLKSKSEYHESNNGQRLTTVWGMTVEGLKIDLIGHREINDEDFPTEVIGKFDFGINMVYYNGSQVCDDYEKFVVDREYDYMSLHNLASIDHLPNVLARFNRLNEKFSHRFQFRAPCLELKGVKPPVAKRTPWSLSDITQVPFPTFSLATAATPVAQAIDDNF